MDFSMRNIVATVFLLSMTPFQKDQLNQLYASKLIDYDKVKSEMELFIKQVKPESIYDAKYNIYLAKIYESSNYECCITMGYIFDDQLLPELKEFKYFTMIDSNLVLLSFSDSFSAKYDFRDVRIKSLIDPSSLSIESIGESSLEMARHRFPALESMAFPEQVIKTIHTFPLTKEF